MTAVTIRDARKEDAPGIHRVARAAWHAAYDDLIGPGEVDETIDSWYGPDRLVRDDVRDPDRPFLVAERTTSHDDGSDSGDDGTLVGFAEAAAGDEPGLWHLYRLYVQPDAWGKGVGTALLERIENSVREREVDELRVSVLADNEVGVAFYEARGFEQLATTEDERFDVPRVEYTRAV